MTWLITYTERSQHDGGHTITRTCASEHHPVEWLLRVKRDQRKTESTHRCTSVVFAMEISAEQAQAMANEGY